MSFPCYNSRAADRYAEEQGELDEIEAYMDERCLTFDDAKRELEAAHREAMEDLAAERAAQRAEDFWP